MSREADNRQAGLFDVLHVDDNWPILLSFRTLLEKKGLKVCSAESIREARLEIARQHDRPFVAVVDGTIDTPYDGIALANTLHSEGIPVFLLSFDLYPNGLNQGIAVYRKGDMSQLNALVESIIKIVSSW